MILAQLIDFCVTASHEKGLIVLLKGIVRGIQTMAFFKKKKNLRL